MLSSRRFRLQHAQQQRVPIADMHSHYGMITKKMAESDLAEDMRSQGVALVAWKLVADARWIRLTSTGFEQAREPAPGDLANFFNVALGRMKSYIAQRNLKTVLTPADVDACIGGEFGIVLASEGGTSSRSGREPRCGLRERPAPPAVRALHPHAGRRFPDHRACAQRAKRHGKEAR